MKLIRLAYFGILFFLCVIHAISCIRIRNEKDLHGTWLGKSEEMEIRIKFDQDSRFEFIYNYGGSDTIGITGYYEVDFSKEPIPLTIRRISQLNHPLHTIIEFKEPNVIKMARFATRWKLRPITFNRETEIILYKQSPAI